MKTHKIALLFLLFLTVFNQKIYAQDTELDNLKYDTKAKMKSLGYKFIEDVNGITDAENVLTFNQKKMIFGYSYVLVSFFKKCTDCYLVVEFWNSQTESVEIIGVETHFNDSSYNISEAKINDNNNSAFFIDYSDKRGTLSVFVKAETSSYLSSMLFYK